MSDRREAGFALAATLWFIALLALVAVIVEGWLATSLDRAFALKGRTAAEAALIGATDRIAFLLVTGGSSPRGLELVPRLPAPPAGRLAADEASFAPETPYIALDDRPYRLGRVTVRLQDEGGLYDIGNPERLSLEKLLRSEGVAPSEADKMADRLADYAKRADPARAGLGGDSDYGAAGLPPPRHARLLTPWELYRVLGWQKPALWRGPLSFADMVSVGPIGGLNVNTVPVKVLAALAGIDEAQAARLVAARSLRPAGAVADLFGPGSGLRPEIDRPLVTGPANIVRLHLTEPDEPLERTVSIRVTPAGPAPYRIDYVVDLPQDAAARAERAAPPPPALPVAAPAR